MRRYYLSEYGVVMRIAIAVAVLAVLSTAPSGAGEKQLLDKFTKQNNSARDKLQAAITKTLEDAKALEKDDPAGALGLLQEVRDEMLHKGLLTSRRTGRWPSRCGSASSSSAGWCAARRPPSCVRGWRRTRTT